MTDLDLAFLINLVSTLQIQHRNYTDEVVAYSFLEEREEVSRRSAWIAPIILIKLTAQSRKEAWHELETFFWQFWKYFSICICNICEIKDNRIVFMFN